MTVKTVSRLRETYLLNARSMKGYYIYQGKTYPNNALVIANSSRMGYRKLIVDEVSRRLPYVRGRKRVRPRAKKSLWEVRPVRIQSYKAYASKGVLNTLGAPIALARHYYEGPIAACFVNNFYNTFDSRGLSNFTFAPTHDPSYVSWCVQKAWNECAKPDGEISVALAELPQTLALLASPFKAIRSISKLAGKYWRSDAWLFDPSKGLYSMRTKKTHPPAKVTKQFLDEATNRWLEVQYGLLPTISDAEVILAAVDDKLEPLREIMYGKSKYVATKRQFKVDGAVAPVSNILVYYEGMAKQSITYTSKVYYRHLNVPDIRARLGFSVSSVPGFIWELTPWSFVLDWFWDIGGLLNRIALSNEIQILSNYVSVKHDCSIHVRPTKVVQHTYTGAPVPNSRLWIHQEELIRLVDQPPPGFPVFNVKWFNITRSLNALSLLWQNLPNKLRS